jgi:hypothetical protein
MRPALFVLPDELMLRSRFNISVSASAIASRISISKIKTTEKNKLN